MRANTTQTSQNKNGNDVWDSSRELTKDSVGQYLEEIAKTPLLTAEEEVALGKNIEIGLYAEKVLSGEIENKFGATDQELQYLVDLGEESMRQFTKANLRLVVSIARKANRGAMPILDMIQEGNTGLIRAVEKFDYAKGFKFSTYATWWIKQAIARGVAQQSRIVRLPVHVAEQVSQVSATRRNLERVLGREPEISEIAAELGIEELKVVDLITYSKDHFSLDAPIDEDRSTSLGDLIAKESAPGPDEVVLNAADRQKLDTMLAELDERSADVVRRRYGLLDGRQAKLADIGVIWGITAERVRQIERSAIKNMRQTIAV